MISPYSILRVFRKMQPLFDGIFLVFSVFLSHVLILDSSDLWTHQTSLLMMIILSLGTGLPILWRTGSYATFPLVSYNDMMSRLIGFFQSVILAALITVGLHLLLGQAFYQRANLPLSIPILFLFCAPILLGVARVTNIFVQRLLEEPQPDRATASLPTTLLEQIVHQKPWQADQIGVASLLGNKRVMIINEDSRLTLPLVRQILSFAPAHLILIGWSETSMESLYEEIQFSEGGTRNGAFPPPDQPSPKKPAIHFVVADIQQTERLRELFNQYRPDVIFQTIQQNNTSISGPNVVETITRKVLAMQHLLDIVQEHPVERYVVVSSVDTVKPTNVTTACNRAAELLVLHRAQEKHKPYVVARLGNVLIDPSYPLDHIRTQINQEKMKRRCVCTLLPNAVQGVLQAALIGRGGEVIVPDQGKTLVFPSPPTRSTIWRPREVGGNGPAATLHDVSEQEDLFAPEETPVSLPEHRAYSSENKIRPTNGFYAIIANLRKAVQQQDTADLIHLLKVLVPAYDPVRETTSTTTFPTRRILPLPTSERRLLLFLSSIFWLAAFALIASHLSVLLGNTAMGTGGWAWLIIVAISWIVLAFINDCYNINHIATSEQFVRDHLLATLETGIFYLVAFFLFRLPTPLLSSIIKLTEPPRMVITIFLALVTIFLPFWWWVFRKWFIHRVASCRALVVGSRVSGQVLADVLHQSSCAHQIMGFIDDDPERQQQVIEHIPVLGTRYDLIRQIEATGSHEIILTSTQNLHSDLLHALMYCYERGVTIKPLMVLYEDVMERIPVEHLGENWFPSPFWNEPRLSGLQAVGKRLIDITFSLIGTIFFLLVLPFVALIIKLDSRGPVFYTQEREGKGGRIFKIIKFRLMVANAEQQGKAIRPTRGDPRITRVGRFLRLTRLDEIPQVLNVLVGDMSIVGPRPERPQFVAQLQEEIPFYRARLSVNPGLTGWAQIKYRYGSTVEDALVKLQYDLYYIKHQSFLFDLLIILRTIKIVLAFKGT